jgi:hypothetical protein
LIILIIAILLAILWFEENFKSIVGALGLGAKAYSGICSANTLIIIQNSLRQITKEVLSLKLLIIKIRHFMAASTFNAD